MATEILYLRNHREVVFIGCNHRAAMPSGVTVPAFNADQMLRCDPCFCARQWRFVDEDPSVAHGMTFSPSVFDSPGTTRN